MACFSPNSVIFGADLEWHFNGRMSFYDLSSARESRGNVLPVPCGKCMGCRFDRSRKWADRMLLELDHTPDALFVTATYDDGHLPKVTCSDGVDRATLNLRDVQLFIKRLRKRFSDRKIRMFYSGEYGDHTIRPHYHFIFYGLSMLDFLDSVPWAEGESGELQYTSDLLSKVWERGLITLSPASYRTFSYVSRYVVKKIFASDGGDDFYLGRVPPFCHQSMRPGLGMYYELDHGIEFDRYSIFDGSKVVSVSMPRAMLEHLQLTNPELYDNITAQRRRLAQSKIELELEKTDLDLVELSRQRGIEFKRRTSLVRESLNSKL